MVTVKESSNFNKGNVNYDLELKKDIEISFVIILPNVRKSTLKKHSLEQKITLLGIAF